MADTILDPKSVFPHRQWACDMGTWAADSVLGRMIWVRLNKKLKISWFTLDFEIISPAAVVLHVRDMEDNVYGGIGEVIHIEHVSSFTEKEKALLDEEVLKLYTAHAALEYRAQRRAEEDKKILKLRQQIFGV